MDRRSFLKSIGAASLLPALPAAPFAAVPAIAPAAAVPAFTQHTYQWAEMIVRAHNKCNIGLLQRSLRVEAGVAESLRSQLIKNGIITAQANAYGIHTATKPLYEGAFMNVSEAGKKASDAIKKADEIFDELSEKSPEIESDFNDLERSAESVYEEPRSQEMGHQPEPVEEDESEEIREQSDLAGDCENATA